MRPKLDPARLCTEAHFTRASFICPLCNQRTTSERLAQHRAFQHAELTDAEYLDQLQRRLRAGEVRFELTGRTEAGVTGTQLITKASQIEKVGVRQMVPGGSPGLKKKRS